MYFPDYNGMYNITTYESVNPQWQGDYATVFFSFSPPDGLPYPNRDVYLEGGFTDFSITERWRMPFNEEKKVYETRAFMKQGYYNYTYLSVDRNNPKDRVELEGNYWETENSYTILIYYKAFADRSDQLIGIGQINSRRDKPGFSF